MPDTTARACAESTANLIGAWHPGGGRWDSAPAADPPAVESDTTWRLDDPNVRGSTGREALEFSLHLDLSSRAEPARGPAVAVSTRQASPAREAAGPEPRRPAPPLAYPRPGATLAGFRLVSELGRGAFARVFLAEQVDLADRPVALKVSRALGAEPQSLARLQHAHIVPIHSVHDDPATGLRLMCMPYLGGANLAQVLETAGTHLPSEATGASLVEALDLVGARHPSLASPSRPRGWPSVSASRPRASGLTRRDDDPETPRGTPSRVRSRLARYLARLTGGRPTLHAPPPSAVDPASPSDAAAEVGERGVQPARVFFRSHSYVQSAVWIAARLAEALEHAHARGLLHRDLKPSNILIAADGTPMLLDFNLSADLTGSGDPAHALLGGTLPYMAPEHLDAFDPEGSTPPEAVDQRSDLYALGLILFEMVAGHHPFSDPDPRLPLHDALRKMIAERRRRPPSARSANPAVPPSLDSILRNCLDPDPARRYQRASDLAEDLRRFLDDRPLAYAPDRNLRERAAKWLRRHPGARGASVIGSVAAGLLLALGGAAWAISDRYEAASAALQRRQFEAGFRECQILLNTSSGPIGRHLERGLERADRELAAYDARDPARFLEAASVRRLPPGEQRALREEVSELILLRARARVLLTRRLPESRRRPVLEDALAWLDRAERIDPRPSAALFQQRAQFERALGLGDLAGADERRAAQTPSLTARDDYLLGTQLAAEGRLDAAEASLTRAVTRDSRRFWAWFALGLCHYDQGRFADAGADFTACTILAPEFAWPHFNRGLALAQTGRLIEARSAYDRALELSPTFAEARVNRALCALQLDDPAAALRDLDRALTRPREGPPPAAGRDPAVRAARAEALARLGRGDEAESQFRNALDARPDDVRLLVARGFFLLGRDPARAEADFLRALALDPANARALLGRAHLVRPADPRAALELVDRALAFAPRLLEALQLRALLRAHLGDPSAVADADDLSEIPTPLNLYNAACALAVLARTTDDDRLIPRAHALLLRALDAGFPAADAANDPDLEPLRNLPDFPTALAPAHGSPDPPTRPSPET